mmetsp:Transcript_2000/g.3106  ORF Transcript_2000/g.3106 Transcript_2000/m.3106 type:complete len:346 (-) Transcript_2000:27-1064(-)
MMISPGIASSRLLGCAQKGFQRWIYLHGKETPTTTRQPRRKGGPVDLILVRHGESEGNLVKGEVAQKNDPSQWTGKLSKKHTSNYRLTKRGRDQAAASGQWIRENISETFDTYLTSEYIRAQETAGYLSLPHALWEVDPLLRERNKGLFVGTVHNKDSSAPPSHPNHDQLSPVEDEVLSFSNRFRKEQPFWWGPPAGESLVSVGDRVDSYLRSLFQEEEGKRVVIVCHGNLMRLFRMRLEGLTQAQYLDWNRRTREKDGGEGVLLSIDNGHVFHYSRRNPDTKEITPTMQYCRFHSPWKDGEKGDGVWKQIGWPLFNNDQLIRHTNSILQMSERREEEGDGDDYS